MLKKRQTYKPFDYPFAYDYFTKHEKMHWSKDEVSLAEDVKDWNQVLTAEEKHFLTQIFRFFTQGDIDVANGYIENYMPNFTQPEIRMMMSSFAAREAVHVDAYAHLLETVGIPETEYNAFLEYQEMKDKHSYLLEMDLDPYTPNVRDMARTIAAYSAFGEGLQLFSSFAMLLNFQNYGKMKGMCQIVAWSIRDEQMHVDAMTTLYRTLCAEHEIYSSEFNLSVYKICHKMVELEDKFIDLAFELGGIEGITPASVKQYVRYVADLRLKQLGLKEDYFVSNPFPWLDYLLNGQEHTNFFENRATSYTKSSVMGAFEDVYKEQFGA